MTNNCFWCCCCCILGLVSVISGLLCESYDVVNCHITGTASSNFSACFQVRQCDHAPGITSACFAVFGIDRQGGQFVLMKGCTVHDSQHCTSFACHREERLFTANQSLYFCCCSNDFCNRDVKISLSNDNKKNGTFTQHDLEQKSPTYSSNRMSDFQRPIEKHSVQIWPHVLCMTSCMIFTVIAVASMMFSCFACERRRARRTHTACLEQSNLAEVVCSDNALDLTKRTFIWKKRDFELITCLVRGKCGEIWLARLRGCRQEVRIRLSVDSGNVYLYDQPFFITKKICDKKLLKSLKSKEVNL